MTAIKNNSSDEEHTKLQAIFPDITIESLSIKNIKCFTQVYIPFNRISLIIGSNARGKSTILQLLAIGLRGISTVPFSYSWKKTVNVSSSTGKFDIRLRYQNHPLSFAFHVDQDDVITCIDGLSELHKLKDKIFLLGYGANRTIRLEDKPPYQDMEEIATLFGENAYLKHIKASENFTYVNKHFKIIRRLVNAVLATADSENSVILERFDENSLYFKTPSNPHKLIPIEALSEGFKSTFVWIFDMILRIVKRQENLRKVENIHGIILLDEIDLHLHPVWQRTILSGLHKLFPNIQFIVTTHSPFVAQAAKPKDVILLESNRQTGNIELMNTQITSELSYRAIVRELFHIESPFSDDIEQEMKKFYEIKNKILRNDDINEKDFKRIVSRLAERGIEIEGVIRREIHDLERRTGKGLGI